MKPDREYPIYLHCPTCGYCTRHCMIFDGTKYVDLVCQTCQKSAACAPKAKAATSSPWPRYGEHEQ